MFCFRQLPQCTYPIVSTYFYTILSGEQDVGQTSSRYKNFELYWISWFKKFSFFIHKYTTSIVAHNIQFFIYLSILIFVRMVRLTSAENFFQGNLLNSDYMFIPINRRWQKLPNYQHCFIDKCYKRWNGLIPPP